MKANKTNRRNDALERLKASTFENSKAKRLGTKTQEQWQKAKDEEIARLSK